MEMNPNLRASFNAAEKSLPSRRRSIPFVTGLAGLLTVVALTGAMQNPSTSVLSPQATALPIVNQAPAATGPNGMLEKQAKGKTGGTVDAEGKKMIAANSAELLALAHSLKTEVDKTNKNMLSVSVVDKARQIEKLAHNVREQAKFTYGPS